MAGLIPRLRAAWTGLSGKASAVGDLIAMHQVGQPQWTPRDYRRLADEGYTQNVITFRCVQIVAQSIASLDWLLYRGTDEVTTHPLLDLLARPNPLQSSFEFFEAVIAFRRIAGNAYVEAVPPRPKAAPLELWTHRPDRMQVVPRKDGLPGAYRYTHGGQWKEWKVDPITNKSLILHLRDFHPLSDWYGFGPIEAAARAIDQHNAAGALNASMLQNGIVPSGVLAGEDLKNKSVEDLDSINLKMRQRFAGPGNAGKVLLLPGTWKWQQLGQSLADMQWTEGLLETARQICAAWGVPHVLIVPGESTYNNRTDARLELFENTILPQADALLANLNWWLVPMFGEAGLRLDYDKDKIAALAPRRTSQFEMVTKAFTSNLITLNEAREALQYDAVPDGDMFATERMIRGDLQAQDDFGLNQPANDDKPARQAASRRQRLEVKASFPRDLADSLDDEAMTASMTPVILDTIRHFGRRALADIGFGIGFNIRDPRVSRFIRDFGAERVKDLVGATTREELSAAIAEVVEEGPTFDKLVTAIRSTFNRASRERAQVIARTETVRSSAYGVHAAGVQAGIDRKQWLSTLDTRLRDTHRHMHLQVRRMEEPFVSSSGDRGQYPGNFSTAAECVNCRCTMLLIPDGTEPFKGLSGAELEAKAAEEYRFFDDERRLFEADLQLAVKEGFQSQELRMIATLRRMLSEGAA